MVFGSNVIKTVNVESDVALRVGAQVIVSGWGGTVRALFINKYEVPLFIKITPISLLFSHLSDTLRTYRSNKETENVNSNIEVTFSFGGSVG